MRMAIESVKNMESDQQTYGEQTAIGYQGVVRDA